MKFVHVNDEVGKGKPGQAGYRPPGEKVRAGDERLPQVHADIGQKDVDSLDQGYIPEAYNAWLAQFVADYSRLKTIADFNFRNMFTFKDFLRALKKMPKGKAVGAGGLSVELLLAVGKEAQAEFYEALMQDVERGCLPSTWGKVLYVLLVKPLPNNPNQTAGRRENSFDATGHENVHANDTL